MVSKNEKKTVNFSRFVIRTFEWELAGYTFLELKANGEARWLGAELAQGGKNTLVPKWWLHQFEVAPAIVEKFSQLLESTNFRGLERHYESDVIDGTTLEILLEDTQNSWRVTCSNEFPEAVEKLRKFLDDEILENQKAAAQNRKRMTHDQAQPIWESVF